MIASRRRKRYSAHVISRAILHWYSSTSSMPRGISPNCSAVRDWALRTGTALRKLVQPSFKFCVLFIGAWQFFLSHNNVLKHGCFGLRLLDSRHCRGELGIPMTSPYGSSRKNFVATCPPRRRSRMMPVWVMCNYLNMYY